MAGTWRDMQNYSFGAILLIAGLALLVFAVPNKHWGRPRFLNTAVAMAFYPGLILALFVFGVAELLLASQGG